MSTQEDLDQDPDIDAADELSLVPESSHIDMDEPTRNKISRIVYTRAQLHLLEKSFNLSHYPNSNALDLLAKDLNIPVKKIRVI